ncbi:MAG: PIN domain nuclease [Clostridia bacterium]|nr:PIN domain nuclease [Clostridia bacterium]
MQRVIRLVIAVLGAVLAYYASFEWLLLLQGFSVVMDGVQMAAFVTAATLAGFVVFYLLAPAIASVVVQFTRWLEGRLFRVPAGDIAWGGLGVIVGLIIAFLLGPSLGTLPTVGAYLPTAASLLLGYLGWAVAVRKRDDWVALVLAWRGRPGRGQAAEPPAPAAQPSYKILDTSVIIDGRIVDLCESGFLEGTLVVPNFVLDELRRIADHADPLKRQRGRRGLDVLNELQDRLGVPVLIDDREVPARPGDDVDTKLVLLAKELGGKLLTNDFNLSKVAKLQGVEVLNVNELANALKPILLPGEELVVHVVREGKEDGQGVGFLEDGTMVVVEGGKAHVRETIETEVTSVLQTNAGRMIFAKARQPVAQAN